MLDFGRDLCTDPQFSTQRGWLVTRRIGGYGGTASAPLRAWQDTAASDG